MNNCFEKNPSSPNNFPRPNQTLLETLTADFIIINFNQENERPSLSNSLPTCDDFTSTLIRQQNCSIGRKVRISQARYSPKDREDIKNQIGNNKCIYNLGHWAKEENEYFYRGCQKYGWGRWKKIHQHFLPKR